ncbi:LD-carboxypeptidase [Paenarthrobacter sp. OM7]|uniref:LD-carboxypeptidase n=1 Tax=Paenarthrobacter sp. AMU7 TaxID=3162492 RepID=A0AB39YUS7_9MICC|nr:LD-carboxypeptidase [Paenarthrobacter sp. OM7]WGM22817.1 LD-carboxypeptidase [Paenarthrobacter sp. OM7]
MEFPELGPLKVGDRVGLVAPSGPATEEQLSSAEELLRSWGLVPVRGKNVLGRHPRARYLAGTDGQRAADLQDAWLDDSLTAVFCIRGGYGSVRLLDLLDVEALRSARPKALIGSSDVTGLHEFWEQNLGLATWFAPMVATNAVLEDASSTSTLHKALFRGIAGMEITHPEAEAMVPGIAHGPLTGGNLSLLAMTTGSRSSDAARAAGKIVLLEDVTEEPYRLDGLLHKLIRSGYFEGAHGIALGTWDQCGEPGEVKELIEEVLVPLNIPMAWGLRFGHGGDVASLPLGVPATLHATENTRLVIG